MVDRTILRLSQVMAITGYKRTAIYELMKKSAFPKSYLIGARAVGWDSLEVAAWVNSKLDRKA